MVKVNYVIATWAGNRRINNKNYLKEHLLKISTLKHNLSQITIVRPLFQGIDNKYYEVDNLINEIGCDVLILDRDSNIGESYGQLFHAYETFKNNFDYYIFCEDDYLPNIDEFDKLLLLRENKDGYLCSFSGINDKYPNGGCSVSNGLISTKMFEIVYSKTENPISKLKGKNGNECHKNFADLLIECGLTFKDFSNDFSVPYFGNYVIEYGNKNVKETIFSPNQIKDFKMNFRPMLENDVETFLDIRNQSLEFLHNNKKFNTQDAKKWFKETKPKFFIIQLNAKMIGYFRTSNWARLNKTIYLGCDLSPNYRGYGFAQEAYIKFIPLLSELLNLNKIKLEVLENNHRAKHIYNKLGFKEIGYGDTLQRDDMDIKSIIMEYEI